MIIKKILILTLFTTFSLKAISQQRFQFKLILPPNIKVARLHVAVDNGEKEVPLEPVKHHNDTLYFSGNYYGLYAGIVLNYPKTQHLRFQNIFFIQEKPATIVLHKPTQPDSLFGNYSLVNAFDFKRSKKGMSNKVRKYVQQAKELLGKYGGNIFNGEKPKMSKKFFSLNNKIRRTCLSYVLHHGNAYYSFFYFRRNIVPFNAIAADSLINMFNTTFPERFKKSNEGKWVMNILQAKVISHSIRDDTAPNFTIQDIKGNPIALSNYKNEKLVLLTFWATWCGPCRAELPILKEIRTKYSKADLVMISASYNEGNYNHYLEFIKKHQMNWINVYNNTELNNAFGEPFPIPQTFLIGKNGKIIYSRTKSKKKGLSELKDILKNRLLE